METGFALAHPLIHSVLNHPIRFLLSSLASFVHGAIQSLLLAPVGAEEGQNLKIFLRRIKTRKEKE